MAAIITEHFRRHNAEQFYESFSEASASTYYLFIGKSSPFTSVTSGGSDVAPPSPVDDVTTEYYKWDSMLAAKLISSSDVSYVIPRRDFSTTGTYDMYEHDVSSSNTTTSGASNLYNSTFYFITDEYRVYKVLDNNGGSAWDGSAAPTSEVSQPIEAGGYVLQYMYKLTTSQIQKFLTSDFMPVVTDSVISGDADDGAVDAVRVTAGSGYTDGTYYAAITGDGSSAVARIVVSSNAIVDFGVSASFTGLAASGTGYTYGSIDLSDCYTSYNSGTGALSGAFDLAATGAGGAVQVIISPKGGHGFDAVAELGGHYVMMNSKLEQADGDDFSVANDFREVGIVKDPYDWGTTNVATSSTARQTYVVKFASAPLTDFEVDEKVTQATTGAVGRVVEWDSSRNLLYIMQEQWSNYGIDTDGNRVAFSGANTITGATSTAAATPDATATSVTLAGGTTLTLSAGYANPELEPDSGHILYVENRRPISRASDQTEDIKIVVEF